MATVAAVVVDTMANEVNLVQKESKFDADKTILHISSFGDKNGRGIWKANIELGFLPYYGPTLASFLLIFTLFDQQNMSLSTIHSELL